MNSGKGQCLIVAAVGLASVAATSVGFVLPTAQYPQIVGPLVISGSIAVSGGLTALLSTRLRRHREGQPVAPLLALWRVAGLMQLMGAVGIWVILAVHRGPDLSAVPFLFLGVFSSLAGAIIAAVVMAMFVAGLRDTKSSTT